ncbi:MAG: peptidase [Wenzhouxiangella sp.]|nr:MAG: peptidase [Wenzhouxiangella sp.]
MTYCVAIRLEAGLVFCSDSRTSAGVDDVSVYSKMHRFQTAPDRMIVLLSAGNLATTQAVTTRLERDLVGAEHNLNTIPHLDEIARYVGELSQRVQNDFAGQSEQSSGMMEASFILGGQIRGQVHEAFLIYPQGNYIAASRAKPFLQIGETKYGKPILDRMIRSGITLERAGRCAMLSMDASMRSNLSVGPPIELMLYEADTLKPSQSLYFDAENPYLKALSGAWADGLDRLFAELPRFDWE